MNNTEIKKALYKQKPKAEFDYIKNGIAYYRTSVISDDKTWISHNITFEIPVDDMGDAAFTIEMDAKLLNRWIVVEEMA